MKIAQLFNLSQNTGYLFALAVLDWTESTDPVAMKSMCEKSKNFFGRQKIRINLPSTGERCASFAQGSEKRNKGRLLFIIMNV